MKCRHCDAPKATERFDLRLCLEKRKKRSIWLCSKCDLMLQRHVLRFIHAEAPNGRDA